MLSSRFRITGFFIGIAFTTPVILIIGYFTRLFLVFAFRPNTLAAESFEECGLYTITEDAEDLYFRKVVASQPGRGGSALQFSARDVELTKILDAVPPGYKWLSLDREFYGNCLQCMRYTQPVKVPAGSLYWKGAGAKTIVLYDSQHREAGELRKPG